MIDKAFVSSQSGAATTINYASNLFITISSVFVVAMSNVVFPSISKNYEEGNISYVRELLKHIITVMLTIFAPFILTVCCFGKNIIALLYERGEFTPQLTTATAVLFAIYTIGALGYVCQELLNKILYLDSRYKNTVIGTIAVVLIKPLINYFVSDYGAFAVAISTAVLFTLYGISILLALRSVTGKYFDRELCKNILKILASSTGALIAYFVLKTLFPTVQSGKFTFIISLSVCGVIYVAMLFISGIAKKLYKR